MRTLFTIHYMNGTTRTGTIYAQSNIMMDDGELFTRLDQVLNNQVSHITFN